MDTFVFLTPLVVLAVILLLGFTGCQLVFPAQPPKTLTLKIQVPTELTVDLAQFRWIRPGSSTLESSTTLESEDGGSGITELSQAISNPALGSWMVNCRMQVTEGPDQAGDSIDVSFTLDEETPGGEAIFQALGRPANNNFRIVFNGLVAAD